MTNHKPSNHWVPPPDISEAELIDWFLFRLKLSSAAPPVESALPSPSGTTSGFSTPPATDQRDIRGVSVSGDVREFFIRYPKLVPSADEVKTAFDYWAFVDPVFTPSLKPSMIPEDFKFPTPAIVTEALENVKNPTQPLYHWQWALEDCVELSLLSDSEKKELMASLPAASGDTDLVCQDLLRTLHQIDEVSKSTTDPLSKLRKWIKSCEAKDFSKLRNSSLLALAGYAELLHKQLLREQLLDSIEEIHAMVTPSTVSVLLVVDDIEKVKSYILSENSVVDLLKERSEILGSPKTESTAFSYPFGLRGDSLCPRRPQLGPYCHICRQAKPNLAKCLNRLTCFYSAPDCKDLKTMCHRKFCMDCLAAYNWPQPGGDSGTAQTASSGATANKVDNYKCPVCAKLCTCDRCVRNVFLKSISSFITGMRGQPPPHAVSVSGDAQGIDSVYQFYSLISQYSAFSHSSNLTTPESPTDLPFISGRARRLSINARQEHGTEVVTGRKSRSRSVKGGEESTPPAPTSYLLKSDLKRQLGESAEKRIEYENILKTEDFEERKRKLDELGTPPENDTVEAASVTFFTQPQDCPTLRRRRRSGAASISESLYRSQN